MDKQGNLYCCKMDTKLLKVCDIILCSSLTSSMGVLFTSSWSLFSWSVLTNLPNVTQNCRIKWFSFFVVQRYEWCLVTIQKCKLHSGSLLLLLPLMILTHKKFPSKNIIHYYYTLDDKNNCSMNDSMKLCILDLLSCELALFSIVTYSLDCFITSTFIFNMYKCYSSVISQNCKFYSLI